MATATFYHKRQPQPVWRWMILFILITLVASFWLIKAVAPLGNLAIAYFNTHDQTFTGVITDTRPGGAPMRSNLDARYALYDGHALYVLSDQQTPRRFVARKVRVRGTLRKNNNILDVKAIDPA